MVAAGVLLVFGGMSRRVETALDCCDWLGMFLMNVNLWGKRAGNMKVDTEGKTMRCDENLVLGK